MDQRAQDGATSRGPEEGLAAVAKEVAAMADVAAGTVRTVGRSAGSAARSLGSTWTTA